MRMALPLLLFSILILPGCGGILQSLREESAAIDREYDRNDNTADDAAFYASQQRRLNGLSANNVSSHEPPVVRGYGRRLASFEESAEGLRQPASRQAQGGMPVHRRMTRNDFRDTDPTENSLWDAQGQGNFLFAHNRQREPGDLVTVDVEKELRREIQYQLWMTLPPSQRRVKRKTASEEGEKKEQQAAQAPAAGADERNRDAAEEAAKTNLASGGKDDDIVRMEVAENLGNGMVRVVGQKRVIYRGAARLVEVVALVNGKDIDDNNRIKSSSFLDMRTQVIQ